MVDITGENEGVGSFGRVSACSEEGFALRFGAIDGREVSAVLGDDGGDIETGRAVGVGGVKQVIPLVGIGIVIVELFVAVVPTEVAKTVGAHGVVIEVPGA